MVVSKLESTGFNLVKFAIKAAIFARVPADMGPFILL